MNRNNSKKKNQTVKRNRVEEELRNLYYDPQSAVAFGGVSKLLKEARKKNISPAQMERWLKKQLSYNLHKGLKRKLKKTRVIVNGMDEQWQADLVDIETIKRQ